MAKSFKTLRERMTPEAQARARDKTTRMMKDMALHELRSARYLTQGDLAEQLKLEQPAVSKLSIVLICTSARCASTSRQWEANWKSSLTSRKEVFE